MVIEEEIISQTTRVRCNGIPFLVHLDFKEKRLSQVTKVSDGHDTIPYVKLILDREAWAAAVELKEYIDKKFALPSIEADRINSPKGMRRVRGGNIRTYTFKPKNCLTCGTEFTPKSSKQKQCGECVKKVH